MKHIFRIEVLDNGYVCKETKEHPPVEQGQAPEIRERKLVFENKEDLLSFVGDNA